MMVHKKYESKIFYRLKYVFPLIGVIVLLLFLDATLKNAKEKFEERLFLEEVDWVRDMTEKLESEEAAYSDSVVNKVTRDYMISAIEDADKTQGVFSCVMDSLFNPASIRHTEKDKIFIENLDISKNDRDFITENKTGYIDLKYVGRRMKTFFASYPKNNTEYYILAGISPYLFDELFNIGRITLALFAIVAVMLFFVYSSIIKFNK